MCEAKDTGLCVCATSDGLPETPAGRQEFLLDLTAPVVGEDEEGQPIRDPEAGIITPEQMRRALDVPYLDDAAGPDKGQPRCGRKKAIPEGTSPPISEEK